MFQNLKSLYVLGMSNVVKKSFSLIRSNYYRCIQFVDKECWQSKNNIHGTIFVLLGNTF